MQNTYIGLFLGTFVSILVGCFRLFVYSADSPANHFVGGDAYNFIIAANHAIAWFVLALIFAVIGSAVFLVRNLGGSDE